eukprot:CAMPEP_0182470060 /NCGR_PEP_ID=MMETSP1319-20130603/18080_1 /TAXON_ID=172717 /ORGANISM="Bolidomonas pacifica, Strain RCC208" /LENGTH=303 /DNA_ID=CAMNT_0024670455 /DNA_START=298 /DNA_END=1206 /DNA_ORIENTATION=-
MISTPVPSARASPLPEWREEQNALKCRVVVDDKESRDQLLTSLPPCPQLSDTTLFGGIDLTEPAPPCTLPPVASYVVVRRVVNPDTKSVSYDVAGEAHEDTAITAPYVPGFLSFREAPPLLPVLMATQSRPDFLLCDGNGQLHPSSFGLASHLGLLLEDRGLMVPTIGAAKNLHVFPSLKLASGEAATANDVKSAFRSFLASRCWQEMELEPGGIVVLDNAAYGEGEGSGGVAVNDGSKPPHAVLYLFNDEKQENPCGAAFLKGGGDSVNPIFVSVGHRLSLSKAIQIVSILSDKRVVEPVRL